MSTLIWHDRYEHDWLRAFPLGNGRLGAMVFGDPDRETIEINEESLWSGRQIKETSNSSPEALEQIRALLFEGESDKAAELCDQTFHAFPRVLRFFESFGEVRVDFADKSAYTGYRKELELRDAAVRVSYRKGGTLYRSETFVSEKYDALVYRVSAEGEPFSCAVTVQRDQDAYTASLRDDTLVMNGQVTWRDDPVYGAGGEGMKFSARLRVVSDGTLSADKHAITVKDATCLTVYAAFATNYNVEKFDLDETVDCRKRAAETLEAVASADYESVLADHIRDHRAWYETLRLRLDAPAYPDVPTDERLRRMKEENAPDPDLCELYYNFGRYLLIESSGKRATLPPNLQGIWSHGYEPPWGSDYHTNINLQMTYWRGVNAGMSRAFAPLLHMVKMLSAFGAETARELFGARGWAMNHTTDVFGKTGVHDTIQCGFFPMSGPWLCLNLWEHYEFTGDRAYLREIYPILKGSCEFVMDFLIEHDGYLVTCPSNSPENKYYFVSKDGEKKANMFTYGATIDFEIIYALFTRTVCASERFGDGDFAARLRGTLALLPPLRVSERYGTLCEWIKDYEETEPGHRHISPLVGLFPGDQINETDPEIYQAAKNTIARRVANGCGDIVSWSNEGIGWSNAWIVNFYARLKDGGNALEHLHRLLRLCTAGNLFDKYPTRPPVFQIEANLGAVSGVTEMLIQSHLGAPDARIVELLPALPDAWQSGSADGLHARGGFAFDLKWKNGRLTEAAVTARHASVLRIRLNARCGAPGTEKAFTREGDVISMPFAAGESALLTFAR